MISEIKRAIQIIIIIFIKVYLVSYLIYLIPWNKKDLKR